MKPDFYCKGYAPHHGAAEKTYCQTGPCNKCWKINFTLNLIKAIRESFPGAVRVYTEGSCYKFYLILSAIFPEAIAYYDFNHVITRINDEYYDITGLVEKGDSHKLLTDSEVISRLEACSFQPGYEEDEEARRRRQYGTMEGRNMLPEYSELPDHLTEEEKYLIVRSQALKWRILDLPGLPNHATPLLHQLFDNIQNAVAARHVFASFNEKHKSS